MRKLLIGILMASLILTMTACKGKKEETKGSEKKNDRVFTTEDGSVELCDYKNLTVEKIVYEVREEEIEDEIYYYLVDYADYKDLERPIKEGDYVTVAIKATMNGELMEEWAEDEGFEIKVGAGDYSAKVEANLVGAKIGETLKFDVDYEEDDNPFENGKATVSYEIKIVSAYKEILPEMTEEFLQENIGVESLEALRAYVSTDLAETYEYNSHFQLREAIIEEVVKKSKILEYSDEMYDTAKVTTEEQWVSELEIFGITSMEEIYDTFGMTQKDIDAEIMDYINKTLVLNAICEIEGLDLTEEEYQEGLAAYVIDWGYETEEELLEEYGKDFIYNSIQEDKISDFLIEHATVTERIALDSEYE